MKRTLVLLAVLLINIRFAVAQSAGSEPDAATNAVPQLINYSGTLIESQGNDSQGKPLAEPVGVTFLIFSQRQGGEAVWMETQNIHPDKTGHYSVVLGATTQGLPANLFTSDEPRWLEIQVPGQAPQARALLVAVPYALKAADAETLGGLPASAFVLAKDKPDGIAGNQSAPGVTAPAAFVSPASTTTSTVSVGLTAPTSDFKVTGSPVKGKGTLALNWNIAPTDQPVPGAIMKRDSTGEVRTSSLVANSLVANNLLQANSASEFWGPSAFYAPMTLGSTIKGLRFRNNGVGVDVESLGVPLYLNWIANQPVAMANSVGIGTAAPQAELNLNAGGKANSDDLLIGNNSTKGLRMRDNGAGLDLESIGAPLYVNYVTNQDTYVNPNGGSVYIGQYSTNNPHLGPFPPAALTVGDVESTVENCSIFCYYGDTYASAVFSNDVYVLGNFHAYGTKDFSIDHPLDPLNKTLEHAAIESSEVLNQYSGNIVLDAKGEGTVEFPGWFAGINTDFRYQLTAVSAPGPGLYVAKKITGNSFTIAGGQPGGEVSWQVTAKRNDAYMQAHPFVVEKEKPASARGHYTHPELYKDQPK